MAKEYKFVAEKGMARIVSDLNVRAGGPTAGSEVIRVLHAGVTQQYVGYVLDGDKVGDNSTWFLTGEGDFFWSGNTDIHTVQVLGKVLARPLDGPLVCTQRFGERPEFYKSLGSPNGHNGIDFRTRDQNNLNNWKKPVYSVFEGTVSEASENQFNGKFVRILHTNGYESCYLHLSAIEVAKGQQVTTGAKIGTSGNTGSASEAPHLHLSFRPQKFDKDNGYMGYIDPLPYFKDNITFV
jgi:murein DD-endopeptidase MepM/ murein hydrolase activator NlpD